LITALKGQAADVLYSIPTDVTYKENLKALEDCFGDQHFAAAFHSQIKTRTQRSWEFLRHFAMAVEQHAHRNYPTLPEDHIRREAWKAFVDRVEDHEIKVAQLIGGVNEALRQALELLAIFLPTRSHKISTKTFWRSQSPPPDKGMQGNRNAGAVENRPTSRVPVQMEGIK
jgi:hypothetical protein